MRKNTKIYVLPVLAVLIALGSCRNQQSPGAPSNFNTDWLFIKQDSANIDKILPGIIPNHRWQDINLPHTAALEPLVVTGKQWTGICWYKKLYRPHRHDRNKHTGLLFDGAMNDAIVYVNGAEVARHTGGYLPFYIDLSNDLRYGRENEILVKLDNRENPSIPPGKPLSELDFLYYSGLYRNVTLYVRDKLHITLPAEIDTITGGGVMAGILDITGDTAAVIVSVMVQNDDRTPRSFMMKNHLLDAGGQEAGIVVSQKYELEPGQGKKYTDTIKVAKPALWTPEMPFLYTLRSEISSEKEIIDCNETRIGIRQVEITSDGGLKINGEKIPVIGTNRHQEYPYIGYALSDNASYREANKIKEAGFNFVRCSHYPPSPAFLDACDELGLMVMDAIPGWQFIGDSLFRQAVNYDTRIMCRRDRNHPSVILWEASLNETMMPYGFLAGLHNAVKEEIPFGNNYTCSWMDTICDVFIPARQHARAPEYWNNYNKNRPLLIAEYGDWEYYAQNAGFNQTEFRDLEPSSRNSRQRRGNGERALLQQAYNFQEAHNNNLSGPAIGDANWLMFDYNRGYAPDIEASGIMDIFRLPKFSYWFYRSQAEDGPVCFIANYNLPGTGNTVRVFSNADTVRLFRNDTLLAVKGPDRLPSTANLVHPPFTFVVPSYAAGTLRAEGYRNGAQFASYSVSTALTPAAIRLTIDFSNKPLRADGADIVFVYATIVDSLDHPVFTADSLVQFSVRGDADLIGDNPAKAEAGIATILLRAGTNAGKVMITASSGSLAQAEIMTETKE